jgi:ubiquinone/menaquinone biosynthesis C-methylase UbiE
VRNTDYAQGDYRVVAERLLPAAEALVAWCEPEAGSLVLDSAAGSGNVARTCVRRGCRAVALDLEPEQLRLLRADEAGVGLLCGDARRLPLADASVDHTFSTFGMIYAPDPRATAEEAGRVCRPGGFVGLTAWPAGGFQTRAQALLARLDSKSDVDPDDAIDAAWTSEERITETLGPLGTVDVRRERLESRHADARAWWEATAAVAPPLVSARARMSAADFDDLGKRACDLIEEFCERDADGIVLVQEYLLARVRRGG